MTLSHSINHSIHSIVLFNKRLADFPINFLFNISIIIFGRLIVRFIAGQTNGNVNINGSKTTKKNNSENGVKKEERQVIKTF